MKPNTRPWMILFAVVMHLAWGAALVIDARAGWTTALREIVAFSGSEVYAAVWLIVAALMALYPLIKKTSLSVSFLLLCPQQFLLVISAVGATSAAINSRFADGVVRPGWFIFADQFPAILTMVLHTCAFIELHLRIVDE